MKGIKYFRIPIFLICIFVIAMSLDKAGGEVRNKEISLNIKSPFATYFSLWDKLPKSPDLFLEFNEGKTKIFFFGSLKKFNNEWNKRHPDKKWFIDPLGSNPIGMAYKNEIWIRATIINGLIQSYQCDEGHEKGHLRNKDYPNIFGNPDKQFETLK